MSFKKITTVLVVLVVVAVASIAALQVQRAQANKLKGTIESVSDRGVVMNGKTVAISGDTSVEGTLVPGAEVTIKAKVQPDGSLLAVKISSRDGQKGGHDEDNGKGGKGNGNGNNNGGVKANSGALSRGENEGERGNRSLGQSRQTVSENHTEKDENNNRKSIEIKGTVTSLATGSFNIGNQTIFTNNSTRIVGPMAVGARVQVKAARQGNGSLLAVKIEVNGRGEHEADDEDENENENEHGGRGGNTGNVTLLAPTNLVAVNNGGQVVLSWTDNTTGETGFRIERATDTGFTANLTVFNVPANTTTYTDTSVVIGTTYYYRMFALMTSPASNSASVNVTLPNTALPAPTNLAALFTSGHVNLTWTDNSANETGFRVERATNTTFTAGLFTAATSANIVGYSDNTVAEGIVYYYRVFAFNASGDSAASNTASVTIPFSINAAALYTTYCASCHGAAANLSGLTTARITSVTSGGKSGMPGFSSVLTPAQIFALAQYLGGTP